MMTSKSALMEMAAGVTMSFERLWCSVKYEEVYLYDYDCVSDAKQGLEKYFKFYNHERPHSSLDD